jgi:hypothetical protein
MKAGTADGVVVKKYRKTEPMPDISKNRYRNRTELKKIPKKNRKTVPTSNTDTDPPLVQHD